MTAPTTPETNLVLETHLREARLERERDQAARQARYEANIEKYGPPPPVDYSNVFFKPGRRMVKPPLNVAEAQQELTAMRALCETLEARLAATDAALAATDAARSHAGATDDPGMTAAIDAAKQRLVAAKRRHIVRGRDERAVADAEWALAEAHRVADLARAQQAEAPPTVSRMALRRQRRNDDRHLTYWRGQIRKIEKRLLREAAQAALDRAHLDRLAQVETRSTVQRGLDRARAIVTGTA